MIGDMAISDQTISVTEVAGCVSNENLRKRLDTDMGETTSKDKLKLDQLALQQKSGSKGLRIISNELLISVERLNIIHSIFNA